MALGATRARIRRTKIKKDYFPKSISKKIKAYWANYHQSKTNINQRCPTFAAVACFPDQWDIYEMDANDYSRDSRTIYTLRSDSWQSQIVSISTGRPLS